MHATEAESGAVSNGISKDSSQANSPKPLHSKPSKPGTSGRSSDLSLQIPPRAVGFGSRSGKGLLQSQGSSKGGSSPGGFLRGLSFKIRGNTADGERSSLLTPTTAESQKSDYGWFSIPILLEKMYIAAFTPASNWFQITVRNRDSAREIAVALPFDIPATAVIAPAMAAIAKQQSLQWFQGPFQCPDEICYSEIRIFRFVKRMSLQITVMISILFLQKDDEEIPEEEAVCRSALMNVMSNTTQNGMQLQRSEELTCNSATGAYYGSKGNRQNVNPQRFPSKLRVPADFVVLVLISTICYFFFLEQLLIDDVDFVPRDFVDSGHEERSNYDCRAICIYPRPVCNRRINRSSIVWCGPYEGCFRYTDFWNGKFGTDGTQLIVYILFRLASSSCRKFKPGVIRFDLMIAV
ncbi:hypothetical protein F3Y22_tig00110403pilonHSYRG00160 [Hibiscus syriacus]|uniref:Uncharacterized protein n=1 Tax=Hibiscus syriacus TaxID=106335 RepID=A0A6A3APR7_HIBSY|nr:hypothetical protein F3Y22_tig00110403pilonHSYRG00160 [Hibiscus syriacus]